MRVIELFETNPQIIDVNLPSPQLTNEVNDDKSDDSDSNNESSVFKAFEELKCPNSSND